MNPNQKHHTRQAPINILGFIFEVIGWLKIVASPLLIGLILGALIYFSEPSISRLVFAILIGSLGLIIGIVWANKAWKRKGTIYFLSRIMATPELDQPKEKKKSKG